MKILAAIALALSLAGCGAVNSWNKAAQSIQVKKANAVLLEHCEAGNIEACTALQQGPLWSG